MSNCRTERNRQKRERNRTHYDSLREDNVSTPASGAFNLPLTFAVCWRQPFPSL